jgi:hypothetical protein
LPLPVELGIHEPAGIRSLSKNFSCPFEYEKSPVSACALQHNVYSRHSFSAAPITGRLQPSIPPLQGALLNRSVTGLRFTSSLREYRSSVLISSRFSAICRHIPRRGSPDPHIDHLLFSSRLLLLTSETSLICCQSLSGAECPGFQRLQISFTECNDSCAYSKYAQFAMCTPSDL